MLVMGIDIGTSGVRTAVLDENAELIGMARSHHRADSNENAEAWWDAVCRAIKTQTETLKADGHDPTAIERVAVDGTSGSMVLVDKALEAVTPALMYNASGFDGEAQHIARYAEEKSITRGASSALARMLRLQALDADGRANSLLHQADFVLAKLAGTSLGSDDNNALKLGWDPEKRSWPQWFSKAGVKSDLLPMVHPVGRQVGQIDKSIAAQFALCPTVKLHAGTTDSIAAFLASGACDTGDAVTSLGTTLAIKLLSDVRVDDPASGIYSHLVNGRWLAGGASNTGGGVLAHVFSADDLALLSEKIDPSEPSGLDYYPLLAAGERFPINDPDLQPRMAPRPACDVHYLHGLLESIARIETQAYQRLQQLGAPPAKRIFTAGGGSKNTVWTKIRQNQTSAPIVATQHTEASIGVAKLCLMSNPVAGLTH